jgi:hypothetical protein
MILQFRVHIIPFIVDKNSLPVSNWMDSLLIRKKKNLQRINAGHLTIQQNNRKAMWLNGKPIKI